ncbi:uncharacterized protein FIESC28_09425 [Fusarium coffeatum]|uniref:Uncharacterized protein n=1 Tax=Fusarium coffeatum TaxID=231269 RepID=A0A366R089_9HYPO|nr:uncharacterized protein FIESC28_09425 [Fusarium coffeatum]RBR10561.1 hypothetical protein FIESC28_09425 [Fusarium coffeatum]
MTIDSIRSYLLIPSKNYQLIETEIPPFQRCLLILWSLCIATLGSLLYWILLFPNGEVAQWLTLKYFQFRARRYSSSSKDLRESEVAYLAHMRLLSSRTQGDLLYQWITLENLKLVLDILLMVVELYEIIRNSFDKGGASHEQRRTERDTRQARRDSDPSSSQTAD